MKFICRIILGIGFLICMYLLYKDKIFKKNNTVPKNIVQEDFEEYSKNNKIKSLINELKK